MSAALELSVIPLLFLPASAVVLLDTVITSFCSLWMVFSLAECVQIFFIVSLFTPPQSQKTQRYRDQRGKTQTED